MSVIMRIARFGFSKTLIAVHTSSPIVIDAQYQTIGIGIFFCNQSKNSPQVGIAVSHVSIFIGPSGR